MAKITIKSNPNYNGVDFGIPFVNGVAETEDAWLITMFKEKGYHVKVTIKEVVTEEVKTEDEPEEVVTEEVIEEDQPEPKKKASARKTTKEG